MSGLFTSNGDMIRKLQKQVEGLTTKLVDAQKDITNLKKESVFVVYTGTRGTVRHQHSWQSVSVPHTEDIQIKVAVQMLLNNAGLILQHTPKKCTEPKTELVKIDKRKTRKVKKAPVKR